MSGLYIHIPFCKQKCIYCDFYSIANQTYKDRYVSALLSEFELRKEEVSLDTVNTIYIGGGTPSLLSLSQLTTLVNSISRYIDLQQITEFTIEMNPEDISLNYLQVVKSLGFNRVSIGVQSFDDNELKIINRRHNASKAIASFNLLRSVGFDNISIDLIYGLPAQSIQSWNDTIDTALRLQPEHISAYGLMYEEGTLLYRMRSDGRITECSEETYLEMCNLLENRLRNAGYEHYEISNFAKPNKFSKHNSAYWNDSPYLGLGAGAHSYDGVNRRYNPNNIHTYLDCIENKNVAYTEEFETKYEKYNGYIMTRLRTIWGLDLNAIKSKFGQEIYDFFIENIQPFIASKEIKISNQTVHLTELGINRADLIFRELFIVD